MVSWTFEEKDVDAEGNSFIAKIKGTAAHSVNACTYTLQLK